MVGSRIAHYRVLRKLGEGAMGVVYLAHDESLNRDVALKFPTGDLVRSDASRQRLMAEATAAAALDHPFICKVYETGEADSRPYIAMEYVSGETLHDRLTQGKLPMQDAAKIAFEVVEALECAHEHGLIHRDLKPSNIMLSADGHSKVMDFGLAKRLPGELDEQAPTLTEPTQAGAAVGTLAYMSPEQLRATALDARSDIFAMGIVLFQMLTGAHPFRRESGLETATAILNDPAPALETYLGSEAGLWQHTLDRMLAKDRRERYSSIHEVRTDLAGVQRALASGRSVPPGTLARDAGRRWSRRHAVAAVLTPVASAAVLFLIYQIFWAGPRTALAFQARDWILVTDFENHTGEPVFDKSLRAALMVGIQQSNYVNVVSDARLQQALSRMRKDRVDNLDENLAAEVAIREAVKALLVCSISKVGGLYVLTSRLVDPHTRSTAATRSVQAKGQDEVLPALDKLASEVREKLGESLGAMPSRVVALPAATTSSLLALKAYADGMASVRIDDHKSVGLLHHAVELDPDFALAHVQLGQAWYIAGNGVKGEPHFKKALSLVDRLTVREKLWVQAVVEDWRGNREQAVNRYKVYLTQYPDDAGAWFRLGWTQMATMHNFEDAIEAFNRVLKLDSSEGSAYINLATCYSGLKKYSESIAFYEKAFAIRPQMLQEGGVNQQYGFLLLKTGNTAKARATFESLLNAGEGQKPRAHRSLALLDMYQGRYRSAVAHLREAVLLNRTANQKTGELRDRLFLAAALHTQGRTGELTAELNQVESMLASTRFAPAWMAIAAGLFCRAGKPRTAVRLYEQTAAGLHDAALAPMDRSERGDRAHLAYMEGIVALSRGRTGEAIQALELSLRLSDLNQTLNALASANAAAGKTDEAIARYLELTARPELGYEGQEPHILAHYELGKLYDRRKETAKAQEYYQKFLDLWKEADRDLKPVVDAQARLKKSAS